VKLPEADFRPKRRAGYVPSSRRRKIPLLRVVLIVVAAALVYRHFDHFWPGLKGWIHPSSQTKGAHGLKHVDLSPYIYSADSSQIFLTLGQGPTREKDACAELEHLHEGLCAQERAALKKAGWMHALNKPILSKMEVSLPHAFGDESPTGASTLLVVLEGWDSSGSFHYTRKGGDTLSPWCDVARGCLTSPIPHLPMIQGKLMDSASEELVARWHSSSAKVFPVLPGIVSHTDSLGPQSYQITLYHGNELYTSYGSLQSLAPGLKPGVQVDLSRSLGEAASMDSASLAGAATPVAKTSEKTKAGTPPFPLCLGVSCRAGRNARGSDGISRRSFANRHQYQQP
jgi:hypothetical protein